MLSDELYLFLLVAHHGRYIVSVEHFEYVSSWSVASGLLSVLFLYLNGNMHWLPLVVMHAFIHKFN